VPSFVVGADQAVAEDAPAQTVAGWVSSIVAGPADEVGQSVSFTVTVDDGSLFAVAPAVAADGTLTYTVAANANGATTVRVVAVDSAGASSAEQTAALTITAVNDVPSPQTDGYVTQNDTPLTVAAPGVLDNDWDEEGGALSVTLVDDPANGSVTFGADGSFVYTPDLGFVGTDSFDYTVVDGGGATASATIVVTVSASSTSNSYFLRPGAPSSDNWQLSPTPSSDPAVLDYDNDGDPGLTIEKSDGKITNTDPDEYQNFDLIATPIALNGPVTLDLTAATSGLLLGKSAHIQAYLQDCARMRRTDLDRCACLQLELARRLDHPLVQSRQREPHRCRGSHLATQDLQRSQRLVDRDESGAGEPDHLHPVAARRKAQ
jgi:hypothetical protein